MGAVPTTQSYLDKGWEAQGAPMFEGDSGAIIAGRPGGAGTGMRPAGQWLQSFYNPNTGTTSRYAVQTPELYAFGPQGRLVGIDDSSGFGSAKRGKTAEEITAEQVARNAEIANRKAAFDAQQNAMYSGYFDFLNKPMEVNPFQVQNGQAIMGRPTYGGQPPQVGGNMAMTSAFQQRAPQILPGGAAPVQAPQADLGQMYSLFTNPYLAELATILFGNSSWLKNQQGG